jgi:small-conductance mechanosensitive channel
MELYEGETCRCDEKPADRSDRFKMLRGLQDAVVVIGVLGAIVMITGGLIAIVQAVNENGGQIGPGALIGVSILFAAVLFCLGLWLIKAFIQWLIEIGGDVRRAADAVESTGEIVARQDAEWRKKAEASEPEERRDT